MALAILSNGSELPTADATSPLAYVVRQVTPNSVDWQYIVSGVPAFFKLISVARVLPKPKAVVRRSSFTMILPVVHSVDSADTLVGTIQYRVSAIIPLIATNSERSAGYKQFINALRQAQIYPVFIDGTLPSEPQS